jgi:signal transduction histidine kinase
MSPSPSVFKSALSIPKYLAGGTRMLFRSVERSVQYSGPKFIAVGGLAVIGFPLYYIIWDKWFPQPYENLPLRMFGSVLFVPMMLVKYWPRNLLRYLSMYWYISILFALPFFFTFMFLHNQGSMVWSMSLLVAVFLLTLLVDWLNLAVMFAIGTALAWLAIFFTDQAFQFPPVYFEYLPIYLFAILAGSVVNFTSERVQQEKLGAMLAAASNIAHELRTPLLGISGAALGLNRYLPVLLESYRIARDQGLSVPPIRTAHYSNMSALVERIDREVGYSNTIIDMLLVNSKQPSLQNEKLDTHSMVDCVEAAIERYPFSGKKQRQLIDWDRRFDFRFVGSNILMTHVLFNLFKNAFRAIARAHKGDIKIWLVRGDKFNELHFRDAGTGIPANVLPRIFQRFYSWSKDSNVEQGTGVGLAFCKTVIEACGGHIYCNSVIDQYTEFVMLFPPEPGP